MRVSRIRFLGLRLRCARYLHGEGLVHRDLSPGNVLVSRDGRVKLVDLGFAKRQSGAYSGHVRGTEGYVSPEALTRKPLGPASDLFSIGAVLYRLITGRVPFGPGRTADVLAAMDGGPPQLPDDLAEDLARLITACLQRDPADRPAAADALGYLDDGPDRVADREQLGALVREQQRSGASARPVESMADTDLSLRTAALQFDAHLDGNGVAPPSEPDTTVQDPPTTRPRHIPRWAALATAIAALALILGVYAVWSIYAASPVPDAERPRSADVEPTGAEIATPAGDEIAPTLPLPADRAGADDASPDHDAVDRAPDTRDTTTRPRRTTDRKSRTFRLPP